MSSRSWTVLVSAVVVAVAPCGASVPRPRPAPMLSNYEKDDNTIRRECGYSSPLPGKPGWSLWLFCDTVIASVPGGKTERLILGTDTAAAGPYHAGRAPSRLSEIPTPPAPLTLPGAGAPQPFLPERQHLLRPGSTLPCTGPGAYPASWISGVGREPAAYAASHLLISYDSYGVTGNPDALTAEGFGLPGRAPSRRMRPRERFAVRTMAQPAYWQNPFTYQYWTGSGWSPDEADAQSLMPARHPFGISVPGRHRSSGTQYPWPAAHFLFRSGRSSRGGVRLSLVIPHPQEHPR